jgi:hypothetical protein
MTRRCRVPLLAASALLAILCGILASPSSGLGAATPRCATANLRLDFVNGQAALSHRIWTLSLRNVGATRCHLKGFPGVGLLDSGANPINDPAFRATNFKRKTVVLGPWQRAYFSFIYAVSGPCLPHFFYAYGIEVFPPNSTQRLVYYRGRFDVCSASLSHPGVYPIRATLGP